MSRTRSIDIDRIALTLDGVAADDARLLAGGLQAAIEARLAEHAAHIGHAGLDNTGDADGAAAAIDAPLVTALRGQALVDAVAARLVSAMAVGGTPRAAASPGVENPSWR